MTQRRPRYSATSLPQSLLLRFAFGNLQTLKSLQVIKTLEHLSYEERLRELESWEKAQGDLVNGYKYLMGWGKEDVSFQWFLINRIGGNGHKSKYRKFYLKWGKPFFILRGVRHWKRLPGDIVKCPSLEIFKIKLDNALSCGWPCFELGVWTRWSPEAPSSLNYFLWFCVTLWYRLHFVKLEGVVAELN